jgi:hypothetical protein
MPTLLDPDHVAALMSPGIDTADLILVIEREEDWLANDPVEGIGQLVGERVDVLWVAPGDDRPILLARPTAAVEVVDGGVPVPGGEIHLLEGTRVERDGAWRGPNVTVTSTPSDQHAVERVLLELVRLTLSASPYAQESSDGHSYARPTDAGVTRTRLARSLRPHRGPYSTRLGTGLTSGRVTG